MSQTALGAKPAGNADASQASSAPKLAGLVLASLIIDLIAATTNALNGALLSQRPDYYKSRQRRRCSPLGSRSTTDQRMGARSQAPASAGSVE